jgi:hypothetical protein
VKLRRPSPALLISCLALFISLGGVSYGVATGFIDSRELKNNTIRTQDLRNNDIRGRDIRNSTIAGRDVAFNTLTGSDISETKLAKVPDADQLDGVDSAAFARRTGIPLTSLSLATGWSSVIGEAPPAWELDGLGYVHLYGVAERGVGATDTILTLPASLRAPTERHFPFWTMQGGPAVATAGDVHTSGDIEVDSGLGDQVSLDGITYKAAGS